MNYDEYLEEFFRVYDYPAEAVTVLNRAYKVLVADSDFRALLKAYDDNMYCDVSDLVVRMKAVSANCGIHEYTGCLVLLICLTRRLKAYYIQNKLPLSVFYDSMADLKYKLTECKLVKHVWGTFVGEWFKGFFELTRFGFDRLQCEYFHLSRTVTVNGVTVTPDTPLIMVHIPRSGKRLDRENRIKSYLMAKDFFTERGYIKDNAVFYCESWLLFPKNLAMLKPTSNLYGFIKDYTLIDSGFYDTYGKMAWRLFDCEFESVDKLPADTSFRRAYIRLFQSGEKAGFGEGLFMFGIPKENS